MKVSKIVALFMALCFCLSMFSGCGAGKTNSKDGKVEISVGGFFPDKATKPREYERCLQTVKRFETKYPNYKVIDPQWTFDVKNYIAMAEGGTLPTIYYVPVTECKNVIDTGYGADITEEFKARGMYDHVSDFMLENISSKGKIYLVPVSNYDQGIVVNIDLYKKAGYVDEDGNLYQPKTWDELAEIAKKIKETTGADGFAINTTKNQGGWRFMPIAWSYGTVFETKTKDGKWKATFDSKECADALQFIKDLKWKYDVLPQNTLLDFNNIEELFAGGNLGMFLGETDRISGAIVNYNMDKNKIGMLSMPAGPKRRVSLMGGAMRVISNKATKEQIKASMDFLEFIGYTPKITDELKQSIDDGIKSNLERGLIVGIEGLYPWNDESEAVKYRLEQNRKNINVDPKHLENYNNKADLEFQSEEPIDAQALYATLDSVIQEVLNNENADINKLLKNAASDFQSNNLDYAE